MNVSTDEASWMVKVRSEEEGTAKKNPPNHSKRVHQIITCKCGKTNKGKYVFKRHVKNIHKSDNFEIFMKLDKESGKLSNTIAKEQPNSCSTNEGKYFNSIFSAAV